MQKVKKSLLLLLILSLVMTLFAATASATSGDTVKKFVYDNNCEALLMSSGTLYIYDCFLEAKDADGYAILPKGSKWSDVAVGDGTLFAIKSDGTLWSAGTNLSGDLGNGTYTNMSTVTKLTQVGKNKKWSKVAGDYGSVAAIAEDGSLWTWGYNGSAQLGDGTFTNRLVPTQLTKTKDWAEIHVSNYNVIGIKKDKSVWAWGASSEMRLNIKTNKEYITKPTKIIDKLDYKKISVGAMHTLVIKNDGSLWGWGSNIDGRLGAKEYKNGALLHKISGEKWKEISASGNNSYAIKEDGTLWSAGYDGITYDFRDAPYEKDRKKPYLVRISQDKDWSLISKGTSGAINLRFMKTDGRIFRGYGHDEGDESNKNLIMVDSYTKRFGKQLAEPVTSKMIVNDEEASLQAYQIEGNIYFKLRDLAMVMSGTNKPFEVGYNSKERAITVTSNTKYTSNGTELKGLGEKKTRVATLTAAKLFHDNKRVQIATYTIKGNDYYNLRDIAKMLNIKVRWDKATNVINMDTNSKYKK